MTYNVERECSVSKEPGATVVIWLSYSESRRTELRPVKLSFPTQLTRLLLSILRKEGSAFLSLARAEARAEVVAQARAKRCDSEGTATSGGTTSAVTPVLPVTSLKGLSTVCIEGTGKQKDGWVGFTEARGVSSKHFCGFFSFSTGISNYECVT